MAHYKDIVVQLNGLINCVLCKVDIKDSDGDIEDHIGGQNHKQLFIKRLINMNAISFDNNKMNCQLCNIKSNNSNSVLEHIHSENHIQAMESITTLIEIDGGFLQLPKGLSNHDLNAHCIICDRNVDFKLETIKYHLQSYRHRRARSIAVQPLNAVFSVEGNDAELWCKICQICFENYMELIFEHVDENPSHINKLSKLLRVLDGQNICIEKFLFDPKEDKAKCLKCDIEVPCNVFNLQSHIHGNNHKRKV